jgi:hypothetical protein
VSTVLGAAAVHFDMDTMRTVRTVQAVLRFRVVETDSIVTVGGDSESIAALVALLTCLSKTGTGLPGGTLAEGTVLEIDDSPGRMLNGDGVPIPGLFLPAPCYEFPEPITKP